MSFSHWLQSIGVSERAQTVEMTIMIVTIQPSWRNSTPVMPVTMVRGKNTAISVSVEAITETATSLVPCTAACRGSAPRSMWVVTFSSTTIASSTTMPIEMDNAESEMMFSVLPVANRYMNEAMSETGIVMTIIMVARQRPRNMNTTIMTNSRAYSTVSSSEAMVLRMLSEVSMITPSFTSAGRFCCSLGSIFITFSEICTEFAPDCFCMMIIAPWRPPVYVSCVRSSRESTTLATSCRYITRPSDEPTGMLASSEVSSNSPCTRSAYVLEPMSNEPPGVLRFSAPMIEAMVSTLRWYASSCWGSQ